MKTKKAIRYLRKSKEKQSKWSIDGQDMITADWCQRNKVDITDTFIDDGYSACNFDRPDFIRLSAFIEKHHRNVDYLVICAYDRFSREAGEAIVHMKKLQRQFSIKIASVFEGVIFDADDPGSFFYSGMMILKGEDEIIRLRSRINLGIHAAKKKEGRYLGKAPFGYKTVYDESNTAMIIPDDATAHVVKYVFQSYLNNVPIPDITKEAKKMGVKLRGNTMIRDMLKRPVYAGLLHVKAYRDFPEEMVEGIHDPLISKTEWNIVQDKLNGKNKPKQIVNDDMPLRGVLKCHCGKPLTGAASTGRHGGKFLYYKCNVQSVHNNIAVKKAHEQLSEVWELMSLPLYMIEAVQRKSEQLLEEQLKENSKILRIKKNEYAKAQEELESVEQKWIRNQMSFETYQRWYTKYTDERMLLNEQIKKLSQDQNETFLLMQDELEKLNDMKYLYDSAETIQKQNMIRIVFDSSLYYQNKIYRTPFMMQIFQSNTLILKEKGLLIYDDKKSKISNPRSSGAERTRTAVQTSLP